MLSGCQLSGLRPGGLVIRIVVWVFGLLAAMSLPAAVQCRICGLSIVDTIISDEDEVTQEKVQFCEDCQKRFRDCYLCGLPANTNRAGYQALEDGRVLCARDAENVVLNSAGGLGAFQSARDSIESLFIRFTTFPQTNLVVEMVDRIHLQELFTLAGNDYHCPNILGYTVTRTNDNRVQHHISLLTALPLSSLRAVCGHELAHAWVAENLSPKRRRALERSAEEGFCELVAFLYADSLGDSAAKTAILQNRYTRGQIGLFITAARDFGVNDVLDWMKYGIDDRLSAAELFRVRNIEAPPQTRKAETAPLKLVAGPLAPAPTNLVLKAIFWDEKHPVALINDRSLGVQEEGKVRVGTSNVIVRCLAIRTNAARVQIKGQAQTQELRLRSGAAGSRSF